MEIEKHLTIAFNHTSIIRWSLALLILRNIIILHTQITKAYDIN